MRPQLVFSRLLLIAILVLVGATAGRAQLLPQTPALQSEHRLESLQQDLEDIFEDPNFSNAHWGITVQSLETGQYIFRRNDTRSFIPASNQKLFTTAIALSTLGPDFTYTTQLVTDGRISDRTLRGDLIIRGAGDPTLGSPSLNSCSRSVSSFTAGSMSNSLRPTLGKIRAASSRLPK